MYFFKPNGDGLVENGKKKKKTTITWLCMCSVLVWIFLCRCCWTTTTWIFLVTRFTLSGKSVLGTRLEMSYVLTSRPVHFLFHCRSFSHYWPLNISHFLISAGQSGWPRWPKHGHLSSSQTVQAECSTQIEKRSFHIGYPVVRTEGLCSSDYQNFLDAWIFLPMVLRCARFALERAPLWLRGCLHDTGATCTPARVHSCSLGSIFVYMIPPQNVMPVRVIPAWVHPGCCTGARISLRHEISQRYHVTAKRPIVSVILDPSAYWFGNARASSEKLYTGVAKIWLFGPHSACSLIQPKLSFSTLALAGLGRDVKSVCR